MEKSKRILWKIIKIIWIITIALFCLVGIAVCSENKNKKEKQATPVTQTVTDDLEQTASDELILYDKDNIPYRTTIRPFYSGTGAIIGKIYFVKIPKEYISEKNLIKFTRDVEKSEIKRAMIKFYNDDTAIQVNPSVIVYGTFDTNSNGIKKTIQDMTVFEDYIQDFPADIFREE